MEFSFLNLVTSGLISCWLNRGNDCIAVGFISFIIWIYTCKDTNNLLNPYLWLVKKAGIITVIYIYPLIIMTLKIALYPLFSWSFALLSVVEGVGNVGGFKDDRFMLCAGNHILCGGIRGSLLYPSAYGFRDIKAQWMLKSVLHGSYIGTDSEVKDAVCCKKKW